MTDEKKPPKLNPKLAAMIEREQAAAPFRRTISKGGSTVGVRATAAPPERAAAGDSGRAEAQRPIEETVLGEPDLALVAEPPLFADFLETIVPRITLPTTGYTVLEAFSNIDVTAEKIADALRANPYLEHLFSSIVESYKKRDMVESLESAVILLGMQNSRNLILTLQLQRLVRGTHPQRDKDGRINVIPTETLRYALRTEETMMHGRNMYADTAYAAGLVFDALALIAEARIEDPRTRRLVQAYIESVFLHGTRTARVAVEVARRLADFSYMKFVYSAGLIHDAGKAAIAILRPDYIDYMESCAKNGVPRAIRQYGEQRLLGVTHAQLGASICHHFRIFRSLELPVLFHHEPYLLREQGKGLHQLAWVIGLASNIASNLKKINRPDDPVLSLWHGPELQDYQMPFEQLRSLSEAVT